LGVGPASPPRKHLCFATKTIQQTLEKSFGDAEDRCAVDKRLRQLLVLGA